ncbi:DUF4430 domain-containing protein [Collinsella aerofaciens]|uniref:DUF4430 domain-containing protein n=1 Tax=Collinsella aerofaciens TaxID=74426 RepID=UPI0006C00058|nr:DUF4430 domain-containing protein [Collinsella aerofaciens]CUN72346.1 Uncharacterised protein [Collinsella aerofaciens]
MSNKPQDTESKQPDLSFIQLDDAKQKGAASAASAPRRKALVGVLTAACTILIVVSLGFVHPSTSGAWSIDWIIQTVTGESVVTKDTKASGSTTTSGEVGSKDSKSSDDTNDGSRGSDKSDSKKDSESSDKESDKNSDSKKSGEKGAGNKKTDNSQSASQNSANSGGPSAVPDNGSASSGGQSGSQQPGYVTVTVSVTSSAVGNPVSSGGTFTFNEGATVYDALCALGLSVNAHGSSYGTYVAAIGGLAEKEHGGTSGWMYSVNGVTPNTACSNYVLKNGDNVVWYYVTG